MKEATLHLADGRPDDIHIDGQQGVPIEAFMLLTKTRGEDFGHMLVFGGAEVAGRMIVNLFRWAIRMCPESAATLEVAARDIVSISNAARGRLLHPEDGPMTVQ